MEVRPSRHPPAKMDLIEKTDGFLSRGEFSRLYNVCGGLMHSDNPLGKKTNYQALWEEGPTWESRVMELLGCHKIRLVGQDGFWLAHMHEERDGRVHMYDFGRLNGQPPADPQGGGVTIGTDRLLPAGKPLELVGDSDDRF